jgi:hypothetical protein
MSAMSSVQPLRSTQEHGHYEDALRAAIADWRNEIMRGGDNKDRLAALKAVILALSAMIRPECVTAMLAEIEGAPSLVPPRTRGGPIYDNIVQFLPKRSEWDVCAAKEELDRRRVQAEKKDIQNVFGYLARAGRVRRVGRGRYLVNGALLITDSELPYCEPARYEDD